MYASGYGFPNRGGGGGGFPLSGGGGGWEILLGCQFRWWCEPKKNWFWPFKPFSRPEKTFCK